MKPGYKIAAVVIVLLIAAGGWYFSRTKSPPLEAVHPVRGPAVQAVYATGTVEATVMLPISARTTAKLVELMVDEGATVAKDQVLARLEDEDLQQSLEELQAKAVFAEKNYERRASLAAKGYETKSALDQAKADWDGAKAAVARAEAEAAFMKMTAPADGLIIRRDGEVGQMIPGNHPIFWLSCCAPLRVSAEVDEEDIALVKPEQEVLIRADAFPGQVFRGKVQSITPKGDPVARSYRVRVTFTQETPLKIGMTAETNIIIRTQENALLIPNEAVTKANKVWLVQDGRLVEQQVTVGARGDATTEILSGVTMEDTVVIRQKREMAEGQKVRVKLVPQAP